MSLGKAYLVSRLQALLQSGRLHLPRTAEAEVLTDELLTYEIRVDKNANDRYGAFRVGTHDDLVTALASPSRRTTSGPGGLPGAPVETIHRSDGAALREDKLMQRVTIGVDIGQKRDPTAIAAVEAETRPTATTSASATWRPCLWERSFMPWLPGWPRSWRRSASSPAAPPPSASTRPVSACRCSR